MLFIAVLSTIAPVLAASFTHAANPENVDFTVNIAEVLTVSVTEPSAWATGDAEDFLRNKITVSASTNNPVGVTVSMYTNDTTLHNTTGYSSTDSSTYIETLSSSTPLAGFPMNRWGYSIDDGANYGALTTTASQIITTVGVTPTPTYPVNKDVYFGAKANTTKKAGTYAQTVYFAAVTGVIDSTNPMPPVNPSGPEPTNEIAHYNSSTGNTTYTVRTSSGGNDTTTTTVTKGDVTSSYASAHGVTSTTQGVDGNLSLAIALAAGAAVSAASGTAFLIAAKRKKDDDEEEG